MGQGGNGELLPRNGYLHPGQKRLSESGRGREGWTVRQHTRNRIKQENTKCQVLQ